MAFTGMMSAQNLTLAVDGQPVANGDVVTSNTVDGDLYDPEWPSIQLKPEVTAKSDADLDITVEMKNTGTINLQMCWPTQCQMCQPGKSVTASGELSADKDTNLTIDSAWMDYEEGKTYAGSCEITAYPSSNPSQAITFTLNMEYPSTNAVEGIETDANAPAVYYNLQGVRVENPSQGIYIVKRGNKVTKQVVR